MTEIHVRNADGDVIGLTEEYTKGRTVGSTPFGGNAICNECGKKMVGGWDTVCKGCQRTFCYDHSVVVNGWWACNGCKNAVALLAPTPNWQPPALITLCGTCGEPTDVCCRVMNRHHVPTEYAK